jgi:hypothetical protein
VIGADGYGWTYVATPAIWATGINYALGDYIRRPGSGFTYICTTDPGGSAVTGTVAPIHISGEVIDPSDGYGWTWVGSSGVFVWFSGQDFAVNAFIRDASEKLYKCTLDPGAPKSTIEPTHASGAVTGADGFGWTWVSNGAGPTLSPFGGILETFEQTTTATLTLAVATHPSQIIYSATVATTAIVALSTGGAYKGARFRVTRTDAGAGTLNFGTGPLRAMPSRSWADAVYDGTAWVLSAAGRLDV